MVTTENSGGAWDWKGSPVAVLAGGTSAEREISLISGRAVHEALASIGSESVFIDASGDFVREMKSAGCGMAFLALHGTFGEDGAVQRILEEAGMRYTGSGPEASRLGFDKSLAQPLFQRAGLAVPAFSVYETLEKAIQGRPADFPVVVKPASSGSSVGITICLEPGRYARACAEAFGFSKKILVERYVAGRELTVGILGGEPLPVVEVEVRRPFYDYEAKYRDSETRYHCPASLDGAGVRAVNEAALLAYRTLGCEVMARVDVILAPDGTPFVLELNTIPGLTGKSLLPKAARAQGILFPDLCVKILRLSIERFRQGRDGSPGRIEVRENAGAVEVRKR